MPIGVVQFGQADLSKTEAHTEAPMTQLGRTTASMKITQLIFEFKFATRGAVAHWHIELKTLILVFVFGRYRCIKKCGGKKGNRTTKEIKHGPIRSGRFIHDGNPHRSPYDEVERANASSATINHVWFVSLSVFSFKWCHRREVNQR